MSDLVDMQALSGPALQLEPLLPLWAAMATLGAQTIAFSVVAWWTLHRQR